jgi:hypothetical protein
MLKHSGLAASFRGFGKMCKWKVSPLLVGGLTILVGIASFVERTAWSSAVSHKAVANTPNT